MKTLTLKTDFASTVCMLGRQAAACLMQHLIAKSDDASVVVKGVFRTNEFDEAIITLWDAGQTKIFFKVMQLRVSLCDCLVEVAFDQEITPEWAWWHIPSARIPKSPR